MNQSLQLKRYAGLWVAVITTLLCLLVTTPEAAARRRGQRGDGEVAGPEVSQGWVELYEPHADDEMPYRLMKPIHFDSNKLYPVIVSLHGAGGRGTDNRKQLLFRCMAPAAEGRITGNN